MFSLRFLATGLCTFALSTLILAQGPPIPPGGGGGGGGTDRTAVRDGGWEIFATVDSGNYASGTNARCSGFGGALIPLDGMEYVIPYWDEAHCVSLKVKIGGFETKQWIRDPMRPDTVPDAVNVMYDSSHFSGSTITIQSVVVYNMVKHSPADSKTITVTHTKTIPLKNRALLYNHPGIGALPGGDGSDRVNNKLSGQNYTISHQTGAWTPWSLFSDMTVCNLLYINTHGSTILHETGDGDYVMPWDEVTTPYKPGYEQQRQAHIGTGYPPFNSTGNPPINLFVLDACECGKTNNFIRACIPYMNGYGAWLEDQALWAYTCFTSTEDCEDTADVLFQSLVDGNTISRARAEVYLQADDLDIDVADGGAPTDPFRRLADGDIAIYGDLATRIKSVYTGTSVNPVGWYR